MENFSEIKKFVRDLNLNLITINHKIQINSKKRHNDKISWFMPSRNLISYIIKVGGVLSGSRALRCYKINGNYILDRRTKDWDFIVDQDMAFKICEKFNIDMIPTFDKVISVKNQRAWRHPAYSDSYRVGPVDVQILVKDELPEYKVSGNIRFASIPYIINEKCKLIEEISQSIENHNHSSISEERKELSKHMDDMTRVIIKFNS